VSRSGDYAVAIHTLIEAAGAGLPKSQPRVGGRRSRSRIRLHDHWWRLARAEPWALRTFHPCDAPQASTPETPFKTPETTLLL